MKRPIILYLAWIAAFITFVLILVIHKRECTTFYGIAETREIIVNTESPVEVKKLHVVPGQEIAKGDLLVEFEQPELTMRINEISHELEELRATDERNTALIRAQIDQLRAQKALKTSEIQGRIDQLQAQYDINKEVTATLKSLEHDAARAHQAANGSNPLQVTMESLQKELDSGLNELQVQIDSLNKELQAPQNPERIGMERLEKELNLLLEQKNKLYSFAPVRGVIGSVDVKEGEKVSPFIPVLTVHTKAPSYVKGFIHENVYNRISIGDQAEIIPLADKNKRVVGTVIGVGSRIVQFPERLQRTPNLLVWGREVVISIPESNGLLLGEKVLVGSFKDSSHSSWSTVTGSLSLIDTRAEGVNGAKSVEWQASDISDITFAHAQGGTPVLEASGAVYLDDLKKYLVASDSTRDNQPVLYLMNDVGIIEEEVAIQGVEGIDDIEALADGGAGVLYALCSQSPQKDGSFPSERKLLLRVRRDRTILRLDQQVYLYDVLQDAARQESGLSWAKLLMGKKASPVVNIEGMFYRHGGLFLGFRKPVKKEQAVVLEIKNIDQVFERKQLAGDGVSVWKQFDLRDQQTGDPAGISDLLLVDNTVFMLSCSTIKGLAGKQKIANLWAYNLESDSLTLIKHWDGAKPEGIAFDSDKNELLITFDCGREALSQFMKLKKV